ncbi:MAG: M28 family peptidase, partial [Candidatus Thorarchaeota archaeon]
QFMDKEKALLKKCKFMINADMVGANPCKSGAVLNVYRTPYSLPTTLNNVVGYWLKEEAERKHDASKGSNLAQLPWKYSNYYAGSDHYLFTDASVRIPAVMLNQDGDKFYHTSTDTTDKIDPIQMAYATRVITLSALTLCHPRHACKEKILTLCRNEGVALLNKIGLETVTIMGRCLDDPEKVYPRMMKQLGYAQELGQATLDRAQDEWKLISEQQDLKQALKATLEMTYATEMVVARKSYVGACVEAGLEAKGEDHFNLDSFPLNVEVKRKLEYALPPSKLARIDSERFEKYMKIEKEHPYISRIVDEILNLCMDWTPLDEIFSRIIFQFGKYDQSLLEGIVDDLKDLGVIKTKEV